jgi:hypothetical protein
MSEADRTRFFENGINQGPVWNFRTSDHPLNGLEEVMRQASAQGLLSARIEALRVPNDAELIERLNGVRTTPLTAEQEQLIRNMSDPQERRMFLATVRQLEGVQAGTVTPSQYMVNVMQSAADIAGNDGGKFAHLVHLAFNEPSSSYSLNAERGLMGGGHIPVGALLEETFKEIDGDQNTVAGGYNPNIIDVASESTVTHHFAEFLAVGNSLQGGALGNWGATVIDSATENPGDVRSAYFGVMLGQALRNGQITPQQAAELTAWAYTGSPASMDLPPWGNAGSTGYLDPNTDYNIQNWLRMYEEAR